MRIGESYRAFGLKEGVVSGITEAGVRLVRGKGAVRLPFAADVALFGRTGGKPVPAERLALWPGDRVLYRTSRAGAIDFLELRPPVKGTSDDRSAKVYAWEVRRSRRELESAVNRHVDVRRLLGLRESLLVIELQRSAGGEIEAVVFAGKGWGHGVGLCQVGAYGMALRGAKYREILRHYYTGVKIERLPTGGR